MNQGQTVRIKRFTLVQRLFHLGLVLTFLVQSATGLGRMYMESAWGNSICQLFGGYDAARTVHIYVGWMMLIGLAVKLAYLTGIAFWKYFPRGIFGPDSLMPRGTDIKHFFQHLAWFFGGRRPAFDRWGYWEKFDFWAVFWGMVVLGTTGLMMAYPLATSQILPGWSLNVAIWIHRIEALLAMGHVFIIHFFIGHLRRHNFPMDRAMFEGSVDAGHVHQERPAWIDRLKTDGALSGAMVSEASFGARIAMYMFGLLLVAAGLFLLVGALLNARHITW